MKKEIITEKRCSFELGGIRLKTGSVHKDLLTNVCLKNKKGKGVQLSFSKEDIKNLSSLFNELVYELEKEEKIKPDTSPCSTCQNTSPYPFNINCVSCDETFSKYKGEEKEIKESTLKGCGNCLYQKNQMDTQDCENCHTPLLLGWKPYVEPKEEVQEEKERGVIIRMCHTCLNQYAYPNECHKCDHTYNLWQPKEEEAKEEPKQDRVEDKPEPTIKACGNCIYGISGRPSSDPCNDCSPDDDKWEPKE